MTFNNLLMEIQFLAGEFGMLGQAQKLVGLSRFIGSQYLCFKMREKDSSDPLFYNVCNLNSIFEESTNQPLYFIFSIIMIQHCFGQTRLFHYQMVRYYSL